MPMGATRKDPGTDGAAAVIGSPAASEDPKERILSAAGREFADRGYEAATIRDICTAADVNVAAVNYYFGDKRRLYVESVKHAHRQRSEQMPLPAWPPGTAAESKLHDFVANMLARMLGFTEPPWEVRLLLREILHPTEACRELVEDYIRPHFGQLVAILDELARGRIPAPELRRVALGIIGHCFLYRAAGGVVEMLVPAEELARLHALPGLADHVTRQALAALGAAPALVPADTTTNHSSLEVQQHE